MGRVGVHNCGPSRIYLCGIGDVPHFGACTDLTALVVTIDGIEDDAIELPPLVRAEVEQGGVVRTAYLRAELAGSGMQVRLGTDGSSRESSCLGEREIGPIEPGIARVSIRIFDRAGVESAPLSTEARVIELPVGRGCDMGSDAGCAMASPAPAPEARFPLLALVVLGGAVRRSARRRRGSGGRGCRSRRDPR